MSLQQSEPQALAALRYALENSVDCYLACADGCCGHETEYEGQFGLGALNSKGYQLEGVASPAKALEDAVRDNYNVWFADPDDEESGDWYEVQDWDKALSILDELGAKLVAIEQPTG
jgi:hypothetical protein